MRPRELTVNGFRSYATETTFAWDGRDLVGIVGPIGSGKSSILDAIAFALYNQTPRGGAKTKSLINQRRDAAQVALTFDVDGETFKAVRSLRRSGASAHALYRIEEDGEVEMTDKANAMSELIEGLLGLDFDAFRRSVLLAQNQFATFLEATGTERNEVLKGVFGFDRLDAMRGIAKGRLDALGGRLAVLADRRATADSDRADLEVRREELIAAEERAAALEGLRAPFGETKELIAEAEQRLERNSEELGRLDSLADRIPDRTDTDALFESAASAEAALARATEELVTAAEQRLAAATAVEETLAPLGGREGLTAVGDLVAEWKSAAERVIEAGNAATQAEERLAEARRRAKALENDLAARDREVARVVAAEEAARRTADDAEQALLATRQVHRAHALRVDLVVGQPCPVCEQRVEVIPADETPASVDDAERALTAARARHVEAAKAAQHANEQLTRLRVEADGAASAVEDLTNAAAEAVERRGAAADTRDEAATRVAQVLGAGDPAGLLEAARSQVAAAQEVLDAAVAAENQARASLDEREREAKETEAGLGSLRASLSNLAGILDVDLAPGEDADSLAAALDRLRSEWIERRAGADEAVDEAGKAADAARRALADLLDAAGLGAGDDLADVIAAALAERSAKEAEVHLLEKRLTDLEQLAGDEAELVGSAELLRRIHGDLAPSKFLEFVLDERRRILADLASEHFELLSAGRYRFDEDGDFQVVDLTSADAIRAPASLSGGETFLASLALALALAEIVSREGGRLDAFFLDEGFGSLDPEHLDLAMGGVERLVTSGPDRLVVIVSHVPALTERIEDLLVLDRDAISGETRVVSGARGV